MSSAKPSSSPTRMAARVRHQRSEAEKAATASAAVKSRSDIERANNSAARAIDALYDVKMLPRAHTLLSDALAARPRCPPWYVARAQVYRCLAKYQHALYDLNSALLLHADDVHALIARAIVLYKMRRFDEALRDVSAAIYNVGENPGYLFYRGLILMAQGELRAAIPDFGVAATNTYFALKATLLRGKCALQLGRTAEAEADFSAVRRIDPTHPAGHEAYAWLCLHFGRVEVALGALGDAIAAAQGRGLPTYTLLAARAYALLLKGDANNAVHVASEAITSMPKDEGVAYPALAYLVRGASALANKRPLLALPDLLFAARIVESSTKHALVVQAAVDDTASQFSRHPRSSLLEEETESADVLTRRRMHLVVLGEPSPSYVAPELAAANGLTPPPIAGVLRLVAAPRTSTPPAVARGRRKGAALTLTEAAVASSGFAMSPEVEAQLDKELAGESDDDDVSDVENELRMTLDVPPDRIGRTRRRIRLAAATRPGLVAGDASHAAAGSTQSALIFDAPQRERQPSADGTEAGEEEAEDEEMDSEEEETQTRSPTLDPSNVSTSRAVSLSLGSVRVNRRSSMRARRADLWGHRAPKTVQEALQQLSAPIPEDAAKHVYPSEAAAFTAPCDEQMAQLASRIHACLAYAYASLKQPRRAAIHAKNGVIAWPGYVGVRFLFANVLTQLGMYEEALTQYGFALTLTAHEAPLLQAITDRLERRSFQDQLRDSIGGPIGSGRKRTSSADSHGSSKEGEVNPHSAVTRLPLLTPHDDGNLVTSQRLWCTHSTETAAHQCGFLHCWLDVEIGQNVSWDGSEPQDDAEFRAPSPSIAVGIARARIHCGKANVHAILGQYDAAVEAYTATLEHDASRGDAHAGRAEALLNLRMAHDAVLDCKAAIHKGADAVHANTLLGDAYMQLSRPSKAVKAYTAALDASDRRARVLSSRATALRQLGRLLESERDVTEAVGLRPGDSSMLLQRGYVRYEAGQLPASIEDFQQALEDSMLGIETRARVFYQIGIAHANQDAYDDAVAALQHALRLLEVHQPCGRIEHFRSQLQAMLADPHQATQVPASSASFLSITPRSETLWQAALDAASTLSTGRLQYPRPETASSITPLPIMPEKGSDIASVRRRISVVLQMAVVEAHAGCDPTIMRLRMQTHHELAKVLQMKEEHAAAVEHFTLALAYAPTSGNAYLRRGIAYTALRCFDAAADDMECARELGVSLGGPMEYRGLIARGVRAVVLCRAGEEPDVPLVHVPAVASKE